MKKVFLPQFFPQYWDSEYNLFSINFTKEVSIGIIESFDGGYSFLSKDEFEKINFSKKELLNHAIDNLKKDYTNCDIKLYQLNEGKLGIWYSDDDNFTAVRILIPEYHQLIIDKISTDFKFTIPSRDIITCWISDSDEENSKFEQEAKEDFKNEEYNLSSKVYKWSEIKI